MIRAVVALAALSLLACNGCNDGKPPPPSAPASAMGTGQSAAIPPGPSAGAGAGATGETVVRLEDDGKAFDVARGATVTVKLASNAGTGYAWVPSQVDAKVLVQQGDRTSEAASDAPGAPKMDVYRFAAASPGSTTLELALRRAFGSAPPSRSVRVTINVH